MERCHYRDALQASGITGLLGGHDWRLIGTPPLGLDLPSSDIDIAVHAPDPNLLAERLWGSAGLLSLHRWQAMPRPLIARWRCAGWDIELFASPEPVEAQAGWRHFDVERRLLALAPDLAEAVMVLRRAGMKTEPAFARTLALEGDAYAAMLRLQDLSDKALLKLLKQKSF